jgi:protein-S-isoprenylcysteine O-methyltransferase Ste14
MRLLLQTLGWLACSVYATIPLFWLLVHPWAEYWRVRRRSPYFVLIPVWVGMWIVSGALTGRWRHAHFYATRWAWIPAAVLFTAGFFVYRFAGQGFSLKQLGGWPEVSSGPQEQRLVTTGIRSRVRHPVYLGHLCEMLGWTAGTGLAVCYGLTMFALVTGAMMIRLEDAELEKRFGRAYISYRQRVPAVLPRRNG